MTFKNAKSLTIVSVIVIICAIILLSNFRDKKANSTVVDQQQTEVGAIEPLQTETNTSQVDQNASQSESLGGPEAILGYELISSQDISYSNENRMMYWIVLDVKDIPDGLLKFQINENTIQGAK